MADLTLTEQKHVRTALRHLRVQAGAWQMVADGVHAAYDTIEKVVNGRRGVSASLALRVARFCGVSLDDLLEGRYLPGACPHCGHLPDFGDEPTNVDDRPPGAPRGGLKLVK